MPVIGLCLWRRRLHRCLRGLLLNIHGWRLRHGNHRRIPVIGGIIRHSETVATITIAAIITRTEPIPAETETGIETSHANETYSPMVMVPAVVVSATPMMPPAVVASAVVTSPIPRPG